MPHVEVPGILSAAELAVGDLTRLFAPPPGVSQVLDAAAAKQEDGTPVTGGNVSLYNEHPGGAVYPTPVIGMVGLLEDVSRATRSLIAKKTFSGTSPLSSASSITASPKACSPDFSVGCLRSAARMRSPDSSDSEKRTPSLEPK